MLLLSLLTAFKLMATCESNSETWSKLDVQCFSTNALDLFHKSNAQNEIECVVKTTIAMDTGVPVVQFNKLSRLCLIFSSFQSVCPFIISGFSTDCVTFVRFPINILPIYSKLSSLWIADGVSKLENLVCQIDKDTNRFYPVNTMWTSDGLKFDGSSSHMVLNKSSLGFTGGLTWLLRIKRQPRVQPYLEFYECSTLYSGAVVYITHMWEYDSARRGYVKLNKITGPYGSPSMFTNGNTLSDKADEWINVGFTTDAQVTEPKFFYGSTFVPVVTVPNLSVVTAISKICLVFGKRLSDTVDDSFSGTLRALALSNRYMSEAEIEQVFQMFA